MREGTLERINALAKKAKTVGLTAEEIKERDVLRQEYILAIRESLRGNLENIEIIEKDGSRTSLKEQHDKKFGKTENERD